MKTLFSLAIIAAAISANSAHAQKMACNLTIENKKEMQKVALEDMAPQMCALAPMMAMTGMNLERFLESREQTYNLMTNGCGKEFSAEIMSAVKQKCPQYQW